MRLIRDIALLILILTAAGALAYTAWDLHQTQTSTRQTVADLDAVLKRVNSPTGPITETDKLLLALRSTTVHVDLLVAHQNSQLAKYDGYVAQMASDIHGVTRDLGEVAMETAGTAHSASAVLQTVNQTVQSAQPVLASLNATTEASTRTMDGLNARIRDPKIDELLSHIRDMSDSGDKMLADAQWKEHQLLHPDKKKLTFWGGIEAGTLWFRSHIMPPLF